MEEINVFSSNIEDVRDALKGYWGTEIAEDYKLTYLGGLIVAEGNLEQIEQKLKKNVYKLTEVADNVYVGWIK